MKAKTARRRRRCRMSQTTGTPGVPALPGTGSGPTGDGDVVISPSGFGASVYAFSFDFTNEPDPKVAEERVGFLWVENVFKFFFFFPRFNRDFFYDFPETKAK